MVSIMKKGGNQLLMMSFLTMALPTIAEMFMQTILQYVDTAMVGRLGASATAAVSLSSTYSWLINTIFSSISMGFLSFIARAIGEKNSYKWNHAAGMSVVCASILGGVVTLAVMLYAGSMPRFMGADPAIWYEGAWYFRIINMPLVFRSLHITMASVIRSTGDTKTPMKINTVMNLANVFLNYFFIYTMGYGAIGAGIATAISYVFGSLMMMRVFVKNPYVRLKKEFMLPEWNILRQILSIGIPSMLTGMVSCFGYIVATSFVSGMETVIFAAHSIAITAEQMFYIPGYGMQAATSTLIGNSLGEGDRQKEHGIMKVALLIIGILMVISGCLLFVTAEPMMRLFTRDEEVIRIGKILLRIVAFSEPVFGLSVVEDGIFIGLGKTKYPLVIEIVGRWVVRIGGAFIWINYFGGGIKEFWYCMVADNTIRCVLLSAGLLHVLKKEKLQDSLAEFREPKF